MNVAIIADTHVPDRERALPDAFRERVREADHVIHAGDFTDPGVLSEFCELASDLTAVHGNMDGGGIDLPVVTTAELGGVTFAVTHAHLGVRGQKDWLQFVADVANGYADEPRIGVGAHTHEIVDEEYRVFAEQDLDVPPVRVLNPGSATGADPADAATMMTAEVDGGDVDVVVHEA